MNLLLIKSLRGVVVLSYGCLYFVHRDRMGIPGEVARRNMEPESSFKQLDGGFERAGPCLGLYKIVRASEMVRVPLNTCLRPVTGFV